MLRGSNGQHPYDSGRHVIVVVREWTAYGDETGTQAGAEFCGLLGYVASPRQWAKFRPEWRSIVGAGKELHSQKFFQREAWTSSKSPYRGWTGPKARAYLDKLLHVIHSFDVRPIGHAYHIEDFKGLTNAERMILTGATRQTRTRVRVFDVGTKVDISDKFLSSGSPERIYFLGFQYFVTEALRRVPDDVIVNFVFDERPDVMARATDTFKEMKRTSRPEITNRVGLLSFGDSVKYEPLQAADLYAYVWYRVLHGSVTEPLKHAYERLIRKRPTIGVARTYDYRRLIEGFNEAKHADILRILQARIPDDQKMRGLSF